MGELDDGSRIDDSDSQPAEPGGDAGTSPGEQAPEVVAPMTSNPADTVAASEQLNHIIDDTDGREEAVRWTQNQLLTGASFEVVAAELVSLGWAPASADSIVEEAREATRQQRGVRTRDDVVVGVYRKFGRTMRRVRWLIILGIIMVIIAISMMLNSGG